MRKPTKPNPRSITNDKDDNVHPEDWKMHRECIDWLGAKGTAWRSGRESSPWFLYCSLNIPHPPFNTNLTWLQSVDQPAVRAHPPRWSNTSSLHPHDEYMTISKAVDGPFSDEAVFLVRRTYYAMVAETDYLMGQVLYAARASGMYDGRPATGGSNRSPRGGSPRRARSHGRTPRTRRSHVTVADWKTSVRGRTSSQKPTAARAGLRARGNARAAGW